MSDLLHHVFNVGYNGIARELRTDATIGDPVMQKEIKLTRVIWDTGATNSTLRIDVANALGLIPTGQMRVHTANGETIANTYLIDIFLPNKVIIKSLNVSDGDLGPSTEMLIGMDVIGMGDFIIQNYDGKTHFSFCLPHFLNKYDMLEKANTLNVKFHKRQQKLAPKSK